MPILPSSIAPLFTPASARRFWWRGGRSRAWSLLWAGFWAGFWLLLSALAGFAPARAAPESVKAMVPQDAPLQIAQADGSPVPAWLRFDRQQLQFEASAVPDGGLPLQLVVVMAGQRVTVVVSERTE